MINLRKTLLYTLIPASFVCGLCTQLIGAEDSATNTGTISTSTYEVSIPTGVGFDEYNKGTIEITGKVSAKHQLNISMHSQNLFNLTKGEYSIPYTITDDGTVVSQDTSWNFPSDDDASSDDIEKDNEFTKTLSLSTEGGTRSNGDYTDKLVFTFTDKQYYELNVTCNVTNTGGSSTSTDALEFDLLLDNKFYSRQPGYNRYVAEGTTYKVNNIKLLKENEYVYQGEASYTGTVNGNTNVDINVAQKIVEIYFVANGGKTADSESGKTVYAEIGKAYSNYFPTVTLEGKVFVGWYTTPTDGTKVNGTDLVENNQPLYAHWADGVTLQTGETFNNNIPADATKVVFTTDKAPSGVTTTNLASGGSNSIAGWLDGTTYYVSTQDASKAIVFNADSSKMFNNKQKLTEIDFNDVVDTSNVTNMYYMFQYCAGLEKLDLTSFNTSNVTNMEGMFGHCTSLEYLDLTSFDTSKVTNMRLMLSDNKQLEAILVGDHFSTENVSDDYTDKTYVTRYSLFMFGYDEKLPNYSKKDYEGDQDKTYAKTVRDNGYLYVNGKIVTFDANGGTLTKGTGDATVTVNKANFYVESGQPYSTYLQYNSYCSTSDFPIATLEGKVFIGWYTEKTGGTKVTTSDSTLTNVTYYAHYKSYMLNEGAKVNSAIPASATKVVFTTYDQIPSGASLTDLSTAQDESVVGWLDGDTYYISTVDANQPVIFNKDSSRMFAAGSLTTEARFTEITFGENVDTSQVKDFSSMFENCSKLTTLDVSGLNTSSAQDMSMMFYGCSNLETLNVASFDTSNVTSMYSMFALDNHLKELDLSSFNTSNVTDMRGMFSLDTELSKIVATSKFDVTNVQESSGMFRGCIKLDNFDSKQIDKAKAISIARGGYLYLDIVNVKFELNADGATCDTLTKLVEKGQAYGDLPTPTHNDYDFAGWYTAADSTGVQVTSDTVVTAEVSETVTLYAHWKTYTLVTGQEFFSIYNTYNYEYGIDTIVFTDNVIPEDIRSDAIKVVSATGEPSVWAYIDKYTSQKFEHTLYITTQNSNRKIVFNEKSNDMFNVSKTPSTINLSNICFDNVDTSHVQDMAAMFRSYLGETLDLRNFDFSSVTRTYGMFLFCDNLKNIYVSSLIDPSKVTEDTYMFEDDTKLPNYEIYAWGINKAVSTRDGGYLYVNPHTVTFNVNADDATVDTTSMIVEKGYTYGSSNLSLPTPTRTNSNYVFGGWYTEAIGGTLVTDETIFNSDEDITLYAHWNSYLVNGSSFNTKIPENATSIVFTDATATTTELTDLSVTKNKSVVGWLEGTTYYVSTQNEGQKVIFNPDSASMFNSSNITSIQFNNVDTSNVTNMSNMFYGCNNLESIDLSNFDTSKVTTMKAMFENCEKLTSLDISKLDTSSVTDMSNLFAGCTNLTEINISGIDTTKVRDTSSMFAGCSNLTTLDTSKLNTSAVTDMSSMFDGCSKLESLDLSKLNTNNVTNMMGMFRGCSSLTSLNVSKFNTSSVTDMSSMFEGCSSLTNIDVSNFDTSSVNSMESMFENCSAIESLDLTKLDTSEVTNFENMFAQDTNLATINVSSKFTISDSASSTGMFTNCSKLPHYDSSKTNAELAKAYGDGGYLYVDVRTVKFDGNGIDSGISDLLVEKNHPYSAYLENGKFTQLTQDGYKFEGWYTSKTGGNKVSESDVYTSDSNTTLYAHWAALSYKLADGETFRNSIPESTTSIVFTNSETIPAEATDVSSTSDKSILGWYVETTKTYYVSSSKSDQDIIFNEDSSKMFVGLTNLTSVSFNNIDTSKVTTMAEMFKGCTALTSIDLSKMKTSSLKNMESMFEGCTSLTDVYFGKITDDSIFRTSYVTTMKAMFKGCSSLENINISALAAYAVTTTEEMFADCTNLKTVDYVEETSYMIRFKTYKIQNMSGMFKNCTSLTYLNLENAITKTATDMSYMFSGDTALKYISIGQEFNIGNVTESTGMFAGCINLPNYDESVVDITKAKSISEQGYLYQYAEIITFDPNGGTIAEGSSNTMIVERKGYLGALPTAVRDNYDFAGWYTDPDYGSKVTEGTRYNSIYFYGDDDTLYAHWGQNYQLVDGNDFNNLISMTDESEGTVEPTTSIVFTTSDQIPTGYSIENGNLTDFSVLENGSVVGWQDGLTYYISTTKENQDVILNKDSSEMFSELSVETITLNHIDTSQVESMYAIFAGCSKLKNLTLPNNFVTSNVINITSMFHECSSLETIDLSHFDTKNVKYMAALFRGCSSLKTIDISSFDTSSLMDEANQSSYGGYGIVGMFYGCSSLTSLDLSNFDTSHIKMMFNLFAGCENLETLTLSSKFDTSNVINMYAMFAGCEKLTNINLSSFNTENVKYMSYMFANCSALTSLDLTKFDTSEVKEMKGMFTGCTNITELDLSSFDTTNVEDVDSIFESCKNLTKVIVATEEDKTKLSNADETPETIEFVIKDSTTSNNVQQASVDEVTTSETSTNENISDEVVQEETETIPEENISEDTIINGDGATEDDSITEQDSSSTVETTEDSTESTSETNDNSGEELN